MSAASLRDDPENFLIIGDGPVQQGAVMTWFVLFFAGLLEVAWAVGLKYTEGFTKPIPSIATVASMAASVYFLSLAMRSLPMGVAYAVWVGVGLLGAAIVGVVLFEESCSPLKLFSLLLIVVGIVGLKLSSSL